MNICAGSHLDIIATRHLSHPKGFLSARTEEKIDTALVHDIGDVSVVGRDGGCLHSSIACKLSDFDLLEGTRFRKEVAVSTPRKRCEENKTDTNTKPEVPLSPECGNSQRSCALSALSVPLQPLQVRSHLRSVLVTQVAVFLQALVDDPFQFGRQVGVQSNRWRWGTIQNGFEDHSRTFPTEWQTPSSHLVENGTE